MLLKWHSINVLPPMRAKKLEEMKCMPPVTPLKLTSTMSFWKISRTNTPQTGRVHPTN